MAAKPFILRQGWSSPPASDDRPAQEGDYTNPSVLWSAAARVVNLADHKPAQVYGSFVEQRQASAVGNSVYFRGYSSTGKILFDVPEEGDEVTFVIAGKISGTSVNGRIFATYDGTSAGRYDLAWNNEFSRYVFTAYRSSVNTYVALTGLSTSPFINGVLVIRFVDGELPKVYHNGTLVYIGNSNVGSGSLLTPSTRMALAGLSAGSADNRQAGGDYSFFARYDRALSAEACARLRTVQDCWNLLLEPRQFAVPMPSVGGPPTLATSSLSLAVQQARSIAAGMSVAVQAPRSVTSAASLAVQAARSAQASLALAVQQARADVAAVQLAVQAAGVQSAAVDMAVQLAASAAAALDLAVQSQGSTTTGLSLQVQAAASVSTSINLQVQDAASVGVSVSLAVLRQALATAGMQLTVRTSGSAGAGLSVALRVAQASAAVLSLAVQAARTAVAAVDLQVQDGNAAAVGVDLAVQHAAVTAAAVQLAIANAGSANASLAAAVMVRRSVSAAIAASVRAGRNAGAGVELFVFDEGDLSLGGAFYAISFAAKDPVIVFAGRDTSVNLE